ncbi:MAG: cell division protein FtsL [Cypionkella sp.]
MRPLLYVLSFLAVMALGFWAYRENYTTQDALGEVSDLQDEIATLRESLTVQRAEWAYLNRPDRLRDLATINFDRLGLLPMEPTQFGNSAMIAFPPPPIKTLLDIDTSQAVSGVLNADPEQGATP